MGKKSKSSSSGDKWGQDQHVSRLSKKIDKQKKSEEERGEEESESTKKAIKGYHRSMHLSHDNYEKREEHKLRLHISKVKREIEAIRRKLRAWDDRSERAERKKKREEEEKKRKKEEEEAQPGFKRKRTGRLGPETWKLRGGARPAYEVYEFDTRYVDPYIKAHKDALEKNQRSVNAFHVCKGKFGKDKDDDGKIISQSSLLIQECRTFLSLSMQLAGLCLEAKKFKSARETLLEVIELEGTVTLFPITNARCKLMRMYLDANRPDSARRLWEKLPSDYSSVWIRYSAALLEFVSWKILEEKGSDEKSSEKLLVQAIRGNVYCAYYIAFNETFHQVMEYTDEVEDAEDGTLEQAIEYCNSEEMGNWLGTEGALDWIKALIIETLNSNQKESHDEDIDTETLRLGDLEWEQRLAALEKEFEENSDRNSNGGKRDDDDDNDDDLPTNEDDNEGHEEIDLLMYTGMFRTGMDMHLDSLSSQIQR